MEADGNYYRPVRTCGFDSFCQLLLTGIINHNLTTDNVRECVTEDIYEMILNVMTNRTVTDYFYTKRLRLLLPYVRQNDANEVKPQGSHFGVNCSTNVIDCFQSLLRNIPNFVESTSDCELGHKGFRRKRALTNVTRAQIADRNAAQLIIINEMNQQTRTICGIRDGDWVCQGRRIRSLVHTGKYLTRSSVRNNFFS